MAWEREHDVEGFPLITDDSSSTDTRIGPEEPNGTATSRSAPKLISSKRWQVSSPKAILRMAALFKFLIVISGTLIMLPFFRILEDVFCHRHFNDTSPEFLDERKCKDDGVQKSLAYFFGWFALVNGIVGVVIALPYGSIADRIGRKPVLIFSYGGVCFSFATSPIYLHYFRDFNPYYMLIGCFLQAFGGGIPVSMSTLYAIATDVTVEENRGSSFLLLMIGATTGGLLGPLISGILMEFFNPWLPIYIVAAMSPFVIALMFLLPETLQRKTPSEDDDEDQSLVDWLNTHITESLKQVRESFPLLRNTSLTLILVVFFISNPLGVAYSMTLVQYVSKEFGWDIAQTSYLLSPLGVLTIVVLGGLPKIGDILVSRFKMTPFQKDYLLGGLSLTFLALGALIEGFSRFIGVFLFGLFVGTFGAAYTPLARALLTHYVESRLTSRLMALINIVETAGSFFGGPVLALCFQIGQDKGGRWKGLPFLYIAGLCTVARICLLFIRPPEQKVEEEEEVPLGEADLDSDEPDEPDAPLIFL